MYSSHEYGPYGCAWYRCKSAPPDPKAFLLKGEGEKIRATRLTLAARSGSPASSGSSSPTWGSSNNSKRVDTERLPSPPKAGAANARANPPNTTFRKFYERGDLPISVDHKSFKNTIKWKVRAAFKRCCALCAVGNSWSAEPRHCAAWLGVLCRVHAQSHFRQGNTGLTAVAAKKACAWLTSP